MKNKRIDGKTGFPDRHGLYDPALEKDSCGVGFVAHVKGIPSHEILTDAYHINERMDHRGGCGFEQNTGDGAGVMTAIPHRFMQKVAAGLGITLPEAGTYAVGNIFLPHDDAKRADLKASLTAALVEQAVAFVQRLRRQDLGKTPGVAETLVQHGRSPALDTALWRIAKRVWRLWLRNCLNPASESCRPSRTQLCRMNI